MNPDGGPAVPVQIVTNAEIEGGAAIPVYGYATLPMDGRMVEGGPARRVVVLSDADLVQNGGRYVLEGRPFAMPVMTAPAGAVVEGNVPIAVYPVNSWPPLALIYGFAPPVLSIRPTALVGCWMGWEQVGTIIGVPDLSGNMCNAIPYHLTFGQTGIGDGFTAPAANGTDSTLNILQGPLASLVNLAEGTFACWAQVAAVGNWTDGNTHTLFAIITDSSNRMMLRKNANNNLNFYYAAAGAAAVQANCGSMTTAGWFRIAVSWSKSNNRVRIYLNGAQVGSDVAGVTGTWAGAIATAYIMSYNGASAWSGNQYQSALWNVELTPAEVAQAAQVTAYTAWPVLAPTQNTGAYTSATYPAGNGVVSLRFDDGMAVDYTTIYPLLTARGLVAGFSVIAANINRLSPNRMTLANLTTMQTNGMEIMCHSMTHESNPLTFAMYQIETALAAEVMRKAGLNVDSFAQSGNWTGANNADSAAFLTSQQNTVLQNYYRASEAYIWGLTRALPISVTNRQGAAHLTGDTQTLAALETWIDNLVTNHLGGEILFHAVNIGAGGGNISLADFTTFLTYVQGKAGLTCLTPTRQLYAQPV